ncbi:hypothetical protein NPIL_156161 [Nephila pilipes]|uniref:Uncharacterized protein n=1 Tax=Nephila pilipes TaxID=299642 RepID=A0A8X6MMI0_NEPPI|nr:hypothetical protein NPIL_156161 [Nephila pilipes]
MEGPRRDPTLGPQTPRPIPQPRVNWYSKTIYMDERALSSRPYLHINLITEVKMSPGVQQRLMVGRGSIVPHATRPLRRGAGGVLDLSSFRRRMQMSDVKRVRET